VSGWTILIYLLLLDLNDCIDCYPHAPRQDPMHLLAAKRQSFCWVHLNISCQFGTMPHFDNKVPIIIPMFALQHSLSIEPWRHTGHHMPKAFKPFPRYCLNDYHTYHFMFQEG